MTIVLISEKEKWSSNLKLQKIGLEELPKYINDNKEKYINWLDK